MKWFDKRRPAVRPAQVQLRREEGQPFGALDRYVPLRGGELELYRSIREAVPIVDAAIWKLVRLCGGVKIRCAQQEAQAGLDRFLATVDTGRGQMGIQSFLDQYLDSMITCGRGIGEMVLDRRGREIAALLCADPALVEVREGDSPLEFTLCLPQGTGEPKPLPWQELLLFTPFQPQADQPYGVSLLRSMPFLTGILLKIYQALGQNWERSGNLRYAVVCKPGENDAPFAQQRGEEMARDFVRFPLPVLALALVCSLTFDPSPEWGGPPREKKGGIMCRGTMPADHGGSLGCGVCHSAGIRYAFPKQRDVCVPYSFPY